MDPNPFDASRSSVLPAPQRFRQNDGFRVERIVLTAPVHNISAALVSVTNSLQPRTAAAEYTVLKHRSEDARG
jgi:hypothetical protein